jgi:hypothetical protein
MPDSFTPIDFLSVARDLADRSQTEASLRAAVGRVYYAIFITARDKAGLQGTDRLHERVKQAIWHKHPVAAGRFETLRRLRVQADYIPVTRDPTYQDWLANWRLADLYASELVEFLKTW